MRPASRRRLVALVDGAVPVVVALFLASLAESTLGVAPWVRGLGVLAGLVQGGALWWRRSHPELVLVVALLGGVVVQLVNPNALFPFAALLALGSLAARRGPRVSLPGLVAVLGVTTLDYLTASRDDATFALLVAVVPWALGEATRNRRVAIVEESRRAVSEEQGRIARELHDVLAHSVSVIVVQAAAADDVFDTDPAQARAAVRSIETVGREALTELRQVLADVSPASRQVQADAAGLDRLDALLDTYRDAGLHVDLHRDEAAATGSWTAGVDRSAYRILQEALTNALRHAGAHRVEVTVRSTSGLLELEVRDDGHGSDLGLPISGTYPGAGPYGTGPSGAGPSGADPPGVGLPGRGIAGMRQRAAQLGGTLEAGPRPDGGFRVLARLPTGAGR